jgi:hypothetical protein
MLLKSRSPMKNKIIQVSIAATEIFHNVVRIKPNETFCRYIYALSNHGSIPPLAASRARFAAMPCS